MSKVECGIESEVAELYQTLCKPVDCSPPGSSVHGILQTRILQWIAMPSSRESSWPRNLTPALQADSLPLNSQGSLHATIAETNKILCFPGGANGKEPACQCRRPKRLGFNSWVRKIPWRRAWQPVSVLFPQESHGQRSLMGYSP